MHPAENRGISQGEMQMLMREIRDRWADALSWIRVCYYRFMGITVGKKCYISRGAHVDVRRGEIVIGNKVSISSGCYILAHTGRRPLKEGRATRLEDNVKIYVNAVVLPGVKIGRNSVVGAGSVVTRDVPPDVVVMGNPARVIEHLESPKT
jgi:acetyltransferase-like isoleucine patch superfamily enzyme